MERAVFDPLERKNRNVIVCESIREKILCGFWKPGEQIYTEAELMKAFNVSRSTIREALNHLKAGNLIYTVPGLGTFVSENIDSQNPIPRLDLTNMEDMLQLLDFRRGVEPFCAYLASKKITDGEIDLLSDFIAIQEKSAAEESDEFEMADIRFHSAIAASTRNDLYIHTFEMILDIFRKQQSLSGSYEWRRNRALKYHRQLIRAFKKRDSERVALVMQEHIEDTRNYVFQMLAEKA
ncbi:MAG: FCD domain-containing protein [Synergistaceae bacterium]|jgi:GntR family transcriptional repressor for pyruvate dehydrogenase complex|nr:FCD domain-containing protein [Synergistaceae bacterium]